MSIEDPDADRFEQELPAYDDEDELEEEFIGEIPLDADPLDVADQRRTVPVDDEPEE